MLRHWILTFPCLLLPLHLLLPEGANSGPDLADLDRYLAKKLDIVANLSLTAPDAVTDGAAGVAARVVYFGDFQPDETSVFQSSLSLLALLARYGDPGVAVGFVDTAASAGEHLRQLLGVRNRHSIVAYKDIGGFRGNGGRTRVSQAEFCGFRNVQLLMDFVERLLTSAPRRLVGPRDKVMIDRGGEAAILVLTEAELEAPAEWSAELAAMAAQLPTYVGAGRRLAGAFGTAPGSLVYHSPATTAFTAVRVRPGDSLRSALQRLRSESVVPLGAANMYLLAAESNTDETRGASGSGGGSEGGGGSGGGSGGGGGSGSGGGRPLLVLLADPGGQAAAPAALAVLKRLRQLRQQPPLLAATLNPWRRGSGEPEIDWAGILGVKLDSGPCFLLTTDRSFGGGVNIGVFHLDRYTGLAEDAEAHDTALADLRMWLRLRLGVEAESKAERRVEL